MSSMSLRVTGVIVETTPRDTFISKLRSVHLQPAIPIWSKPYVFSYALFFGSNVECGDVPWVGPSNPDAEAEDSTTETR